MTTPFSGITGNERNMMADIVHNAVQAVVTNCYDLKRMADEFSSGDMSDAFTLCFKKGLQEYMMMIDMSEENDEAIREEKA